MSHIHEYFPFNVAGRKYGVELYDAELYAVTLPGGEKVRLYGMFDSLPRALATSRRFLRKLALEQDMTRRFFEGAIGHDFVTVRASNGTVAQLLLLRWKDDGYGSNEVEIIGLDGAETTTTCKERPPSIVL